MIDRQSGFTPELENNSPTYEVTDNFDNLQAVGVIIVDPTKKRILLVRRIVEEFDENGDLIEISNALKNKVDSSGRILLALPSGSGPLSDNPAEPDQAVIKEILSETGNSPISLERFHAYKEKNNPKAKKVGFYIAVMNMDSLIPKSPHKDLPGWFPIEWFGSKITLPYSEHNKVVLDFISEKVRKS